MNEAKIRFLLKVIEDIYKNPITGDSNRDIIKRALKKFHKKKKNN